MVWNRYGSPYDPNYEGKGKITRPQSKREQERREHQLRGCLDPSCPMCNPETASAGLSGRGLSEEVYRSMRDSARRAIEEGIFLSPGVFRIEGTFVGSDNAGPAASTQPKAPPASYNAARKEVEKWLITAPEQAFTDIIGNDEALEQLRDAIQAPVNHKALYEAYGMKMPKGALLSGPPGCGKTMFARAAASEMKKLYGEQSEFISISGSELQSPYVGVTEGYIKAIFVYAREYKAFHGVPLLVFMDEADVLLPDRTGRVRRVASWEESQVATFLAEMDGIQESGAFVMLASNRPEVIDQAVLRDGRCDFKIVVQRPTAEAIEAIIRKNFADVLLGTETMDALVFAAVEALFDPYKIIADARSIAVNFAQQEIKDAGHKHFLLEHIVSGAMAASIPTRAKRRAFTRDKVTGVATGVSVADVVAAVNDVFEENKGLDHSFALNAFMKDFIAEAQDRVAGGGANEEPRPSRRRVSRG